MKKPRQCELAGLFLVCLTGLFAGKPAPTIASVQPPMCVHYRSARRSGFTREYGGGGNGERRVEIGHQARPLRG
ncbi:diguanylate phosphodiesterase [Pseudomonas putida]|nr:diguanylate phosphodiesterase [Pseudomonas sp. RW405]TFF50322.1 diguanylate phosphodiesterase [Pseudomonas putida]